MKTIYLTIGHNVGDTPTHTTAGICADVRDVLGVSAYTAIPCVGMWQGAAEESTRVEIGMLDDADAETIMGRVPDLAARLRQVEIMADVRECSAVYVGAANEATAEAM